MAAPDAAGGARVMLLLKRKKGLWCELCEADQLGRHFEEFESLIRSHQV